MELTLKAQFFNNLQYSKLREWGWDNLIVYSQAMCESGLNNELTKEAHNPFSIKVNNLWKGEVYLLKNNPEEIDGKEVIIPDTFKKYPSFREAIYDYANLIERVYHESYMNRNDYKKFYYYLVNGKYKYATDSRYIEKAVKMYEQLNVNDFKEAINSWGEREMWNG